MRTSQLIALFALYVSSAWAQPSFVYTNNNGTANSVSGFSVGTNGALTPIPGSPYLTGGSGTSTISLTLPIITTFAKHFLYVDNLGSETISAFSIDTGTGQLSPVPGSPFPAGVGITHEGGLAITPDDAFLIVTGAGGIVAVDRIEVTGALTPVPGSPFKTILNGFIASSFTPRVTPDGKFLAVGFISNPGAGVVAMFSISSSGVLTFVQTAGTGEAFGVDCNCESNHLYVGSSFSSFGDLMPPTVVAFNIASNGSLSPLPGSPFSGPEAPGTQYGSTLLSRDDSKLFVANRTSDGITVFDVNSSNGALAAVAGSPFSAGLFPGSMGTDETGTFLYSADVTSHSISAFHTAGDGALTPVPGSPFPLDTVDVRALSLTVFPQKTCCAAPEIGTMTATPDVLWPPDSKLVEVTVDYDAAGACPNQCVLTVSSNEPPAGSANGTTSADWQVLDSHHLLLRAARAGNGTGRIYTITATCTNETNGLSSTRTVTVRVPHDQGH